ncbi:hypothetical protein ACA910_006877 [Epithemia clementina (nom. ined.)]
MATSSSNYVSVPPKARAALYLQSFLQSEDESQLYLIPNTRQSTAADFSVYAQLERLVGEGTKIGCARGSGHSIVQNGNGTPTGPLVAMVQSHARYLSGPI